MQKLIVPGGLFAYYDPADIDYETRQGTAPYEKINYRLVKYGHVAVNGTLLF